MTELVIPPNLIDKLGHNILEIRERALLTLLSKIDNGFIFENDLAQSKEMLTKLFEWFLFHPCPHEEMVLALIKRILLTSSGSILINHYGPNTIRNELKQVRNCLEPKYHTVINELLEIIDTFKFEQELVPPLVSDVPLSYRSGQSYKSDKTNIDTTATSFEGYISKGPSVEQQVENKVKDVFSPKETFTVDRESELVQHISHKIEDILPNYHFQWQPLIEADRHVLDSVENSLKNPLQPSELLHSCEFFTDVLLHDFPAEVFLQRPTIVLCLQDLLHSSSSTRVSKSVLNCFLNLTKALLKRIDHCNDPGMHCLKEYIRDSSQHPTSNSINSLSSEISEFKEDLQSLKHHEISTVKYCITTLKCILDYLIIKPETLRDTPRNRHFNLYNAIIASQELLSLLSRCFCSQIWNVQPHGVFYDVLKDFNTCLTTFGNLIENYRIEVNTNSSNASFRAIHLCILHQCVYLLEKFIPLGRSAHILPKSMKTSVAMTLFDVPVAKLYPDVHSKILEYVKMFNNSESLNKFEAVREVCESMSACVKLCRDYASLCFSTLMALAKCSILSLQFHEELSFVNIVIEACATKFSLHTNETDASHMEVVILSLLSYHVDEIVELTYELCYKKVISAIGPTLNITGTGVSTAQVVFLLRSKILTEMAEYGLSNKNPQVKRYTEDIMIHLMKCKILVTEEIWDKVKEALVPSFPILLAYSSKMTPVGRTLINVVDPDIAKDLGLSTIVVFKSNITLLFSPEGLVRDEAFSRLCWLLASQENSKNLLPRLNNINDKALPNVCQISPKGFDVNKSKSTERFYQPTSLHHVMELLNSPNVEPGIRRSALTQIGVMLEDHLLHDMFLDKGGVQSVIKIMNNALIEEDYLNYSDSVIPAVAILKSICLYSGKVRYELSHDLNLYQCILRGLFLYFTEERMKIDSSILLFLLLYSSFIQGTPSRANMAIPRVVHDKLVTPLICGICREVSYYTNDDITEFILSDKSCLSSIQIHWNSEVYGGFQKLTKIENIDLPSDIKITERLNIQMKDLDLIKVSSVHYSITECLKYMQKGDNLTKTEDILNDLMIYLYLYSLCKTDIRSILNYPWEENFAKFLRILPSSEEDASLLKGVIKFLRILVRFYKSSDTSCWIISILKDPTHYITDIISIDNSSEEHLKVLSKELINLITECVCQEQHFMDFYIESEETPNSTSTWAGVIEMVTDNLKFQDPQQLYNLAYLDSLLSCLVHLSAMLGWSSAKRKTTPKQTMKEIISGLCDLVDAFHYGKGPTAAVSLMGLSITRNVMLILNHILAEMLHSNIKNWDLLFVEDISEQNKIFNFVILWNTRDVVLRAAVLQFFAGLVKSKRLSRDIVSDLKKKHKCLWTMALSVLLDKEEASVVRENAALILANLCTHRTSTNNSTVLHNELTPLGYDKDNLSNPVGAVLEILELNKTVKQLKTLLLCLYTNNMVDTMKSKQIQEFTLKSPGYLYTYRSDFEISEKSWTSNEKSSSDENLNVVTPSLIKGTVVFLHNLIEMTEQPFVDYLNEAGLIKLIFRSICVPSIELKNTKQLSLYSELLEMNSEICFFLNRAVRSSPGCLGTVLHTKDCVNVLVSLLNPKMYQTYLPQLFYLRNKLWTEVFSLIGTFLECGCQVEDPKTAFEILAIVLEAIYNCGPMNLVATICEAIGTFGATELQGSVLLALTLMLQVEGTYQLLDKNNALKSSVIMKHSMQNLLDTVEAPKSIDLAKRSDSDYSQSRSKSSENSKFKMNLLEKIYFGETVGKEIPNNNIKTEKKSSNTKKSSMISGAEICKLLLHLYDIYDLNLGKENSQKQIILAATSSILCVSSEAKYYALDTGFLQRVIEILKEISIKLSLESVDCFRRIGDKKRISPMLKDLDCVTGLLTNFLLDNVSVKCEASCLGLADIVHKVWNWYAIYKSSLVNALKMLSTLTTNCPFACQYLPYTSPIAGTGPRKNPSTVSLLHVIVSKISREMDMLSKTHDILPLRLCFNILQNCAPALECRVCITKSNLLQGMLKLHPALTKRQKPWDTIELIWLEYLQVFTVYPEGQVYIGKLPEVLDLILTLTQGTKSQNKQAALTVLQNIAFYSPNRARLLTTPSFINTLTSKLESGTDKEKITVVNAMWALAANNMKAKTIFKSARLDVRLSEALKKIQLLDDNSLTEAEVERMQYVLDIMRQ